MNADLVAQIVKLATDSKKRSTSKVIDGWQDQIVALAKQIQPEGAAPVVAGLTVQPTSGTVEVGSSIVFQAFGWVAGASQPIQPAVTWASTGGHISTSGTYTAGATPGTFQVTAKLVNGPQEETVPIVVMGKLPSTNPPTPGANPTPVATKLAMSTQPSGARDSTLMDTQPAVRLQDVSSQNVAQAGRTVTVSITSGTGSLSGTTSAVTDSSGIATFTDLKIVGCGAVSADQRTRAAMHAELVPPGSRFDDALTPGGFYLGFKTNASGDTLTVSFTVAYAPDDGAGDPDSVKWIGVRSWSDSAETGRAGAWGQMAFDRRVTSWSYQTGAPERGDTWTYVACFVVKRRNLYSPVACSQPVEVRRPLHGGGMIYDGQFVPGGVGGAT